MKYLSICLALAVLTAGCLSPQETAVKPVEATTTTATQTYETPTTANTSTTTAKNTVETTAPTKSAEVTPANATDCPGLANETLKDACFYDAAGRSRDADICGMIGDRNIQLKCRARITENAEYCDQIDVVVEKDWCYRMMAFRWNKLSYCKAIFHQKIRDGCVWNFVRDKKPDPYECFNIVDGQMRDECIFFHIDLYNRTGAGIKPTLCGLISNETLEFKCNQTYLRR